MNLNEAEQLLRSNLLAAEDRVGRAVTPIYGLDERDQPYLVGSGIVLSVPPYFFLVTAAHVLDENKLTPLYLAGPELFEVTAPSHLVTAPPSGRRYDTFDFGVILLTETVASQLGRFIFLSPQDFDVNDLPAPHTLYCFAGYPETKNRPVRPHYLPLSSTVFVLGAAPLDKYAVLGLDHRSHFVANFNREKLIGQEQAIITGPLPKGMSGGGVWRLGRPDQILAGSNREKLIGIGIEHRASAKVLIGVRISVVVAGLAATYPDIAAKLPHANRIQVNVTSAG